MLRQNTIYILFRAVVMAQYVPCLPCFHFYMYGLYASVYTRNLLAISSVTCVVNIEIGNLSACRELSKSGTKLVVVFSSEVNIFKETQREKKTLPSYCHSSCEC